MSKITLTIDDQLVEVDAGTTVLEAARMAGVEIPTLCYHPALSLDGSCRVCVVEDLNSKRLLASCVAPVYDGMKISTRSARARKARRLNVDCWRTIPRIAGRDRAAAVVQDLTYNLGITRNHGAVRGRETEPKARHSRVT